MKKDLLQSPMLVTFSKLPDPRVIGRCKYKLVEIIAISICGVLCGCETWGEIEEFAEERADWFKKYLALESGLPSHDTLARCFSLIDPKLFEEAFREWIKVIKGKAKSDLISIDGKAVAGTHRGFNDGTYPLYLVNVLCRKSGLALSQRRATGPGHGEIFAAEECLDNLMLAGTVVSMDAGLAVKRISDKIRERGGDYLFPIKKNQRHSLDIIEELFKKKNKRKVDIAESMDKHRGREELRRCAVMKVSTKHHNHLENWRDLKTAIRVDRARIELKSGEKEVQTYYYISSRKLSARQALEYIRSHWGIENKLHWALDVAFCEDAWKVRQRIAAENLSLVRKICFNLLQKSPGKGSKRLKMKKASWSPAYLESLLLSSS